MKTTWLKAIGIAGAAVALLGFVAGCGEDAETDSALGVDPASSTVYADGATVFLTAYDPDYGVYQKDAVNSDVGMSSNLNVQILLPLEWRVADATLGRITASGGYSAVYESSGIRGQNYVFVRDQAGREGIAAIEQRWHEDDPEGEAEGTTETTAGE